jgi:IS605 OrfB family transposase
VVAVTQAYRFALNPTPTQHDVMLSHVGASRFAYNFLLAKVKAVWAQRAAELSYGVAEADLTPNLPLSHYSLRKYWNTQKDSVAPWWDTNSKETYSDGARRLSLALRGFFDSRTGKRRGPVVNFPRFHRRGSHESVRFGTGPIRVETDQHHVTSPVIGKIRTHESTRKLARKLENGTAKIYAATLVRSGSCWFVTITVSVERDIPEPRTPTRIIGVDLGIKTLYVGADCNGNQLLEVANPKHYQHAEYLLRKAQRNLSRKIGPDRRCGQRPSARYLIAQTRVQRIYRNTANARLDLIHKTTTDLAKNFDVIVIEDLNIAGMVRSRHLAKVITDAAFAEFRRQLEYKASWYGATLIVADRWFASSKTCSTCMAVKTKLSLGEREYNCSTCGLTVDRDVNAATNLAWYGERTLREQYLAGGSPVTGRGGKQKTKPDISVAAAYETSTSQQPLLVA